MSMCDRRRLHEIAPSIRHTNVGCSRLWFIHLSCSSCYLVSEMQSHAFAPFYY